METQKVITIFRYILVLIIAKKKEYVTVDEIHKMMQGYYPTKFIKKNEVKSLLNVMFSERLLSEIGRHDEKETCYALSNSIHQF